MAMAQAIEIWQGKGWSITPEGIDAERRFFIPDAGNEADAVSKMCSVFGVAINTAHPRHLYSLCKGYGLSEVKGPRSYITRATYAVPTAGSFKKTDNPLLRPLRIFPQRCSRTVDCEFQLKEDGTIGSPILNAAHQPYDSRPTRTINTRIITFKRFEPFWDMAKSLAFENHVNSNAFSVGPLAVAAGQCICHSIEPTTEYEATAPYVEMGYTVEIDTSCENPFQYHILEKGRMAWYTKDGDNFLGRIVNGTVGKDATPASEFANDALLTTTGKPITLEGCKTPVVCGEGDKLYEAIDSPVGTYPIEFVPAGEGWKAIWRITPQADFRGLGL